MAMMSAVALVSVSCRNGGDDKNEKSTETQIPIRKKYSVNGISKV